MKNSRFFLLVVLLASPAASAERIERNDLKQPPEGIAGERVYEAVINVGPNVSYLARMEVTNKGNGLLAFANLRLRVFDGHDDGSFYDNELLDVEFVDLNADGYKDVIVSGICIKTDDKGKKLRQELVTSIYIFDVDRSAFRRAYEKPGLSIDAKPPE